VKALGFWKIHKGPEKGKETGKRREDSIHERIFKKRNRTKEGGGKIQ